MANGRVIATGPRPPSPLALAGQSVGGAGGMVAGGLLGQHLQRRQLQRQVYNPITAALANAQPGETPSQTIARLGATDPRLLSAAMSQQGQAAIQALTPTAPEPVRVDTIVVTGDDKLGIALGLQPGERKRAEIGYDAQNMPLYRKLVDAPDAPDETSFDEVNVLMRGENRPFLAIKDRETGKFYRTLPNGRREEIPSSEITQVSIAGTPDQVLPPARADDLAAMGDWLDFQAGEIDRMIGVIESDPTIAGAPGLIRRGVQAVTGAAAGIADLLGEAGAGQASRFMLNVSRQAEQDVNSGNLDESTFDELFNNPNISSLRLFENTLAYTLARLRMPEGRLLASVINDAKRDASLTGLRGSDDVLNVLNDIQRQLTARRQSVERRRSGAPQIPSSNEDLPPPGIHTTDMTIDQLLDVYAPLEE